MCVRGGGKGGGVDKNLTNLYFYCGRSHVVAPLLCSNQVSVPSVCWDHPEGSVGGGRVHVVSPVALFVYHVSPFSSVCSQPGGSGATAVAAAGAAAAPAPTPPTAAGAKLCAGACRGLKEAPVAAPPPPPPLLPPTLLETMWRFPPRAQAPRDTRTPTATSATSAARPTPSPTPSVAPCDSVPAAAPAPSFASLLAEGERVGEVVREAVEFTASRILVARGVPLAEAPAGVLVGVLVEPGPAPPGGLVEPVAVGELVGEPVSLPEAAPPPPAVGVPEGVLVPVPKSEGVAVGVGETLPPEKGEGVCDTTPGSEKPGLT